MFMVYVMKFNGKIIETSYNICGLNEFFEPTTGLVKGVVNAFSGHQL